MRFTKSVRATRKGGATPFSFIRRRFRASGSVKGGKPSAFFSITGKKRGGGFDSHEPSSPKVTCIGQVRVKSKKRVKQCRRRIGEVSFRTAEQPHGGGLIEDKDKVWIRSQRLSSSSVHSHREQRWVHLPISVCEALRAFRDEICCFFPCACSCFSRERVKDTERDYYAGAENGCGAVLARWLSAADGGEDDKRRDIEVVVGGGGDDEASEVMSIRSSRRHVFDDIVVNEEEEEEEEEARLSICIPPKNALLLMRCRSDPMRMSSLAHRFSLDVPKIENDEEEDEENHGNEAAVDFEEHECKNEISVVENEAESNLEMEVGDSDCEEEEEDEDEEIEVENDSELMEKADESVISQFGDVSERENTQNVSESGEKIMREKIEEEEETEELERETTEEEKKPIELERESPEKTTIINQGSTIKENKSSSLPECLLLMMCEPKLSMEVSKETWVRGTDFIRLLPERPRKPAKTAAGEHEVVKRRPSIDAKCKPRVPAPPTKKTDQMPARSSCSLPVAAAVVERNQVNARKCEPFALTRCKSEPMSTAAAKLMPEPCCWKNNSGMKMEPQLGVGAAELRC